MDTRLPDYDPGVIEQFAERLYDKAAGFVIASVVAGGALGAGFGAVPLTSLGSTWPVPSSFGFATMLVGAVCGAVMGYFIGDARSFAYKLQAQSALCQLQIERNTTAAAERAAVAPPAPVAAPVPVEPQQPPPEAIAPPEPQALAEPQLRALEVASDAPIDYSSVLRLATPVND
jgi:hypothetical protein